MPTPDAPAMRLRPLAQAWADEIGEPASVLELGLFQDAAEGRFDHLGRGHGVYIRDPENLRIEDVVKGGMLKHLDELERRHRRERRSEAPQLQPHAFIRAVIGSGFYWVHKDAVRLFAESRKIRPPTWWSPPAKHAAMNADTLDQARPKRGRPPGTGFARADQPIVAEAVRMLEAGIQPSAAAALRTIIGQTANDAELKRLQRRVLAARRDRKGR